MHLWLLYFLLALALSLGYGYWLGGYAKRHDWTRDDVRSRAALISLFNTWWLKIPLAAGAVALLASLVARIRTSGEGSLSETLFFIFLGFFLGGRFASLIVIRRAHLLGFASLRRTIPK